ncbi:MAG: hypothetical protein ACYDIE_12855 [Candidatus Krumholzibacteriia bacterium]
MRRGTGGAAGAALGVVLLGIAGGALAQERLPPPRQMHYLVEVRRSLSTGESLGVSAALVRRTETPATGMIVEQTVALEMGEAPRETFTTMQVEGTKLIIADRDARFNGEGELQGPPWAWTGWTTRLELAGDTGTVRSSETVTAAGRTAQRRYFSPAGELRMVSDETYLPISPELFGALYQQLMVHP